jgi:anaerobic selenocysteine-containing dehydrogenase
LKGIAMNAAQPEVHYRNCNLCEAMCGVAIEVEDRQIISIKGDKEDPFSKGHICPKALALKDFHEDPDRLRSPMLKTNEGWKEVSWGKAYDFIASKVKQIQKAHGKDAIGVYTGNPNVHHHGNLLFGGVFLASLNTRNRFSATSNDQLPHMRVNLEMFGHQLLFPVPDIDHTDLFILVGSNPAASNGSLTTAPDYLGRLKNIRRRGGKVILIDPRKTETARVVDEHIHVRPGTDAFVFLAMLNTLFDEGLIETGRLKSNIDDIAQIQLLCSDFTPEYVSPITGLDADKIKSLARQLASTPRAALFGRMGTSTQEFGTLATWLIYVLNVVTNHLDERGGLMFNKPAADVIELAALAGQKGSVNQYQSRSGLPEFSGELPASTMAEQIELPGDGQIKAMFVVAGNPILSSPNGERLSKAFESLELLVSLDSYMNETSSLADVILPSTSQLEQSHYDLVFNFLSVRNVAKFSPPLFDREKSARHDWEIMLELSRRLAGQGVRSRAQNEVIFQVLKRLGPDGLLDIILRTGPYGTQIPGTTQIGAFLIDAMQDLFGGNHIVRKLVDMGPYGAPNRTLSKGLCTASLLNYPHGVDLGSLQSSLPDRLYTDNKRIKLAPASFLKDMSRLRKRGEQYLSVGNDELLMIGRRDVRSNNSWMHNLPRLVKGKNRCTALMHPADAKARGIQDGDEICISSQIGDIELAVELTSDLMEGVISVPHGFGHSGKDIRMEVAQRRPGVNVNAIIDDGFVDRLSGTSVLNGVAVTAVKVGAAKSAKSSRQQEPTKPVRKQAKSRVRVSAKLS